MATHFLKSNMPLQWAKNSQEVKTGILGIAKLSLRALLSTVNQQLTLNFGERNVKLMN